MLQLLVDNHVNFELAILIRSTNLSNYFVFTIVMHFGTIVYIHSTWSWIILLSTSLINLPNENVKQKVISN